MPAVRRNVCRSPSTVDRRRNSGKSHSLRFIMCRLHVAGMKNIHRRQDAPLVYDMTTVAYVTRPHFVLNSDSVFDGKVKAVVIPSERALDIDTELDFMFAEYLLSRSTSGVPTPARRPRVESRDGPN